MTQTDRDYDPMMGTGYFDIWRDGTSFANPASGTFVATLFRAIYDGSPGTFVVDQAGGPFTVGATNGLRWNQSVAGSGSTYRTLEARLEDTTTFNNDKATLSFYASAAVDGTLCGVEVVQFFGSGGTPSADVVLLEDGFCANQTVGRKVFTFAVPSTQAKTFGTNFDDCIKIRIKYPPNAAFNVVLNELRFDRGDVYRKFSAVPLSLKAAHIDRYVQTIGFSLGGNATVANQYLYQSLPFKTSMRRTPTLSFFAGTRANLAGGVPVATYLSPYGATAYIQSAAAGAYYALGEIIKLDARL